MTDPRWAMNEPDVAAKVIDGEAIILNLSNGMYYSLDQVGAVVWQLIGDRRSADEIAVAVASAYDVPPDQVRHDVLALGSQLLAEQLITETTDAAKPNSKGLADTGGADQYHPPQLNKYSDMADLLALDPPMPGLMDGPWSDGVGSR